MPILVDTSVWVDYFRGGGKAEIVDQLIDENRVVTNDLILAELVPFLKIRKQDEIIDLLSGINKLNLIINWDRIIEYQFECLKNGINGVGIPDLIIAGNAKDNNCTIYSLDNHFRWIKDVLGFMILEL